MAKCPPIVGSLPTKPLMVFNGSFPIAKKLPARRYSIAVIIRRCQRLDVGSIPTTCLKSLTAILFFQHIGRVAHG